MNYLNIIAFTFFVFFIKFIEIKALIVCLSYSLSKHHITTIPTNKQCVTIQILIIKNDLSIIIVKQHTKIRLNRCLSAHEQNTVELRRFVLVYFFLCVYISCRFSLLISIFIV